MEEEGGVRTREREEGGLTQGRPLASPRRGSSSSMVGIPGTKLVLLAPSTGSLPLRWRWLHFLGYGILRRFHSYPLLMLDWMTGSGKDFEICSGGVGELLGS